MASRGLGAFPRLGVQLPAWHPSYVLRLPGREEQEAAFQAMLAALLLARKLLGENAASLTA